MRRAVLNQTNLEDIRKKFVVRIHPKNYNFFEQNDRRLISIFRTRKVFHQISNVLSSPVSSLKMVVLSPITTFKKNQPFIWFFVFGVVCKSLWRHWLVKPSLLKLKPLIRLKTSRPRSKTRKVFHQTSNVLSSLVNSLKTEELFLTITSRRSLLFTWSSVFVAVPSKPNHRSAMAHVIFLWLMNMTHWKLIWKQAICPVFCTVFTNKTFIFSYCLFIPWGSVVFVLVRNYKLEKSIGNKYVKWKPLSEIRDKKSVVWKQ